MQHNDEVKVYIVTSGTYSDYQVESIYSTEEKAKEAIETLIKLVANSDYSIDEYTLDKINLPKYMYFAYVPEDKTLSCWGYLRDFQGTNGDIQVRHYKSKERIDIRVAFTENYDGMVKSAWDKLAQYKYEMMEKEERNYIHVTEESC